MKRIVATLLLLLALLTSAAFTTNPVKHALASIVLVQSVNPEDGKPTTCTGVMVAPRRALTAAHCVTPDAALLVDSVDALVMARTNSLLLVSAGNKKPLKLGRKVRLQEPITSFGYGWGEMTVLGRRVAVLHGEDFATDGPLAPGMSGGPTVNAAGELVGINQASNGVIGIVCGPAEIRAFLVANLPLQR